MPSTPQRTANVETFLLILSGHLTQYDIRQSRGKHYNHYALAHYLVALEKVRKCTATHASSDTPEAMKALLASFRANFVQKGWDCEQTDETKFVLPPINAVVKKMNAWINDGKFPKYPGMKR